MAESSVVVKVPMDFGVENLQCPVHSNIKLLTSNNETVNANSMILSYNSTVFHELFFVQLCTSVDVSSFSKQTVTRFLEALYSGQLSLDHVSFREIAELADKFSVRWLMLFCGRRFDWFIESAECCRSRVYCYRHYEDWKFIFNEAAYGLQRGTDYYWEQAYQWNLCKMTDIQKKGFLRHYVSNFHNLTFYQLDAMLRLVHDAEDIIFSIVYEFFEKNSYINKNMVHLLENINMDKFIEFDIEGFDVLFGVTLKSTKGQAQGQTKIVDLSVKAAERFVKRKPHLRFCFKSVLNHRNWKSSEKDITYDDLGEEVDLIKNLDPTNITNLFHPMNILSNSISDAGPYKVHVKELVDLAFSSKEFKNMYMVLELFQFEYCELSFSGMTCESELDEILNELVDLKYCRSWDKVHSSFVKNWVIKNFDCDEIEDNATALKDLRHMIQECSDLVDNKNGIAEIVSNSEQLSTHKSISQDDISSTKLKGIRMEEFVAVSEEGPTKRDYKFYWKHPGVTSCSNPSECGFIIRVTLITKGSDNEDSFNMEICTDENDYNADIHYHPETMEIEKMHVAVRRYLVDGKTELIYISWADKPVLDISETKVMWSDSSIPFSDYIAVVVYYDVSSYLPQKPLLSFLCRNDDNLGYAKHLYDFSC